MKDGFIKVATVSPDLAVGDVSANLTCCVAAVKKAAAEGAMLVVLPELSLTGYTCGDLFLQQTLQKQAVDALFAFAAQTAALDTVCCIGLPLAVNNDLYNVAAVVFHGAVLGLVPKISIPNYSEFYEARHFAAAPVDMRVVHLGHVEIPFGTKQLFCCDTMPDFVLGVEICEDLWVPDAPSNHLAMAGATVIANLSASDETVGKEAYRRQLVCEQSARLVCGYLYCDAGTGESSTDMVFSGHHLIAENGALLAESKPFEAAFAISEIDCARLTRERIRQTTYPSRPLGYLRTAFSLPIRQTSLTRKIDPAPFVPSDDAQRRQRCEQILRMQAAGLVKRLRHTHGTHVVLGLSGGLDSTLALLVCLRAFDTLHLDKKGIVTITMPGFGTTGRTKNNAAVLAEQTGVTLREISIAKAVHQHFADIGHDESCLNVVYENGQARERTQILMDVANQVNGLVIGTGDLSELALGWATYNGDHMSMYGVNVSIPKTLVRYLVSYEAEMTKNEKMKSALLDVLDTPVSPELLPAKDGEISQKTEQLVGPYELHDFYLYHLVRLGFPPSKILRLAQLAFENVYAEEEIHRWLVIFLKRFFAQQFKRSCLPDGPKVGSVTLSPRGDWRMPSDAVVSGWLKELEQNSLQSTPTTH